MQKITIPRLGWSMEEGKFISWLKKPGDLVSVGEPLFELEGEKSLQEIESVEAGILYIPADAPYPAKSFQWVVCLDIYSNPVNLRPAQILKARPSLRLDPPQAMMNLQRLLSRQTKPASARAQRRLIGLKIWHTFPWQALGHGTWQSSCRSTGAACKARVAMAGFVSRMCKRRQVEGLRGGPQILPSKA